MSITEVWTKNKNILHGSTPKKFEQPQLQLKIPFAEIPNSHNINILKRIAS